MPRIDRCVCRDRTFADLKNAALRTGARELVGDLIGAALRTGARTISELQSVPVFGDNCELCHPYVRAMLRTGETVFTAIIEDDRED